MFSSQTERALRVAVDAHAGQLRKGLGAVPYCVHPVHVALLVRGFRDDDEVVQAALLHDVVEDCEGWTHERIELDFGHRVAGIVAELSEDKSQDWATRKRIGIERVSTLSDEAALVQSCDKLHNLHSLLVDLRVTEDPQSIWRSFNGGRKGTLEVARSMVEALAARATPTLAQALREVIEDLETAS